MSIGCPTGLQVPVPELVAWRSENETNSIYFGLVSGVTLEFCWSTLTTVERMTIAEQLEDIVEERAAAF